LTAERPLCRVHVSLLFHFERPKLGGGGRFVVFLRSAKVDEGAAESQAPPCANLRVWRDFTLRQGYARRPPLDLPPLWADAQTSRSREAHGRERERDPLHLLGVREPGRRSTRGRREDRQVPEVRCKGRGARGRWRAARPLAPDSAGAGRREAAARRRERRARSAAVAPLERAPLPVARTRQATPTPTAPTKARSGLDARGLVARGHAAAAGARVEL
jgi:hypothetical protein